MCLKIEHHLSLEWKILVMPDHPWTLASHFLFQTYHSVLAARDIDVPAVNALTHHAHM